MAKTTGNDVPHNEQTVYASVLHAGDAGQIVIPGGDFLLNAEFERSGPDLVLVGADGTRVLVMGFFADETPPDLVTQSGAVIDALLADKLAGSLAPGQYAQTDGGSALTVIGKVSVLSGKVMVKHADGTRSELHQGDPIFKDDLVDTDKAGAVGITFGDGTTFSLGGSGRMLLDDMVYDPSAHTGSGNISVLKGAFTFISGQIPKSHPDALTVKTPVMTVGIRGTAGAGNTTTVVLLAETGGLAGELTITTSSGQTLTINTPGLAASVGAGGTLATVQMSPAQIQQLGGSAFGAQPNPGGLADSYGSGSQDQQNQPPNPLTPPPGQGQTGLNVPGSEPPPAADMVALQQQLISGIREIQQKIENTVQQAVNAVRDDEAKKVDTLKADDAAADAAAAKEAGEFAAKAETAATAALQYANEARQWAIQGNVANTLAAVESARKASQGLDRNAIDAAEDNRGAEDYSTLAATSAAGHGTAQSEANRAAAAAAKAAKAEGIAEGYLSVAMNAGTAIAAWKDASAIQAEVTAAGNEASARQFALEKQGAAVIAASAATTARYTAYDLTVNAATTAVAEQIRNLARTDAQLAYLKAAKELTEPGGDLTAIAAALEASASAADIAAGLAAADRSLQTDIANAGGNIELSLLQVWRNALDKAIADHATAATAATDAATALSLARAYSEAMASAALEAAKIASDANTALADKASAAGIALGYEVGAEAAWQASLEIQIEIAQTTISADLATATGAAAHAKADADAAQAAAQDGAFSIASATTAKASAHEQLAAAQSAQTHAAAALESARAALAAFTTDLPANYANAPAEVKAQAAQALNLAQLTVDRLSALKASVDQQVAVAQQQDSSATDALAHAQSLQAVLDAANVSTVSAAQSAAAQAQTSADNAETSAINALSKAIAAKESALTILADLQEAGAPAAQIATAQQAVDALASDEAIANTAVGTAHAAVLAVAQAKTAIDLTGDVALAKALAQTAAEQAKTATTAASDGGKAAADAAGQLAIASAAKAEAAQILSDTAADAARAADVAAAQAAVDQIIALKAQVEAAKTAAALTDSRLTATLGSEGDPATAGTLYGKAAAALAAKTYADGQTVDAQAKLSADQAYSLISYGVNQGAISQALAAQLTADVAAGKIANLYAAMDTALTAAQTALENAKAAQSLKQPTTTFASEAQKQLQTAISAADQAVTQKSTVDSAASTFDTQADIIASQSQLAVNAQTQAAAAVQVHGFAEQAISGTTLLKGEAAEVAAHLQQARTHADELAAAIGDSAAVAAKLAAVQSDLADIQSDVAAIEAGAGSYFALVNAAYQAALAAAGSYPGAAATELARAKAAWEAAGAAKLEAEKALAAATVIATQAQHISDAQNSGTIQAELIAGYKANFDSAITELTTDKATAESAEQAAIALNTAAETRLAQIQTLLGANTDQQSVAALNSAMTLAAKIAAAATAATAARAAVEAKLNAAQALWDPASTATAKAASDGAQTLANATTFGSAAYSANVAVAQANYADQYAKQWPTIETLVYQHEVAGSALTAGNDSATVAQGGTAQIAVLANDQRADHLSLSAVVTLSSSPLHGTVTITPAGELLYTANSGFSGTETLYYTVTNTFTYVLGGTVTITSTASAQVTIVVTEVNHAPNVADFTVSTTEDTALTLTATDFIGAFSDGDGNALASIVIMELPQNGTLLLDGSSVGTGTTISAADLAAGKLTFQPAADWPSTASGTTTFTWKAMDDAANGALSSAVATTTIAVTGINDAPILTASSAILPGILENSPDSGVSVGALIAGKATDVEQGSLGIAVTGIDTAHGTWQYAGSNGWTDIPAISAGTALLLLNSTLLRFVPGADWSGTADFTFRAWDGTSGVNGEIAGFGVTGGATAFSDAEATATITVTPINNAPVLTPSSASIPANSDYTFSQEDFTTAYMDAEGSPLATIKVTTLPDSGSLLLYGTPISIDQIIDAADLSGLTFQPAADFSGVLSFSWQASDGQRFSAAQDFAIAVTPYDGSPSLSGIGSKNLAYNVGTGAMAVVADTVVVSDPDSGDLFNSVQVSIDNPAEGDSLYFSAVGNVGFEYGSVYYNSGYVGTVSGWDGGTTLTITFNTPMSAEFVQDALRSVVFRNDNGGTVGGERSLTITVTDATDVAGEAVRTIAVNPPPQITVSGPEFDMALGFDSAASVAATTSPVTTQLDSVTAEMWFSWSGKETENPQWLFYNGEPYSSGFGLCIEYGELVLVVGSESLSTGISPVAGEWQHIAVVRDSVADGGTWHVYVDGMPSEQTFTATISGYDTNPGATTIGNNLNADQGFLGLMDSVMVWNEARTREQIAADMQGQPTGTPVASWQGQITVDSDYILVDSSPNGNDIHLDPDFLPKSVLGRLVVEENTPVTIVLTVTDDQDSSEDLVRTLTKEVGHGTLTWTGDTYVYTPDTRYVGADSFVVQVTDAHGAMAEYAFNLFVQPTPPLPAIDPGGTGIDVLTVANDLVLDSTASIILDVGATTGINDLLSVGGTLHMAETLTIRTGETDMEDGAVFTPLEYGALSGAFDSIINLDDPLGEGVLDPVFGPNSLTLTMHAVTHSATATSDTITGGSGADYICGGTGNDIIHAGSGADVIAGQSGNDTIGITGTDFHLMDGGIDLDRLVWEAYDTATLDFSIVGGPIVQNFEILDVTASGEQTVILDGAHLLAMTGGANDYTGTSDTLVILGDNDIVNLVGGGWSEMGVTEPPQNPGTSYSVYSHANGAQVYVDPTTTVTVA